MSGGWAGSARAQQLPPDWPRRRARVLARDGYRCRAITEYDERCTEPADEVDHIRRGGDHRLSNLQSLCAWHHGKKSAREGAHAARLARPSRYRPREPHPGEITPS
ncbi:HNH endonuclease [Longispora albida]|uniref:HNH endonuclease n=1 Tax=Longispora albida TaxID=203523 RepID=UPI000476D38E|nr:HNH endonuclease signature motif containing protein [Longispora albida]